jgi:hypothetical protein
MAEPCERNVLYAAVARTVFVCRLNALDADFAI